VLRDYLDRFASTPEYGCDVAQTAPTVLHGNRIIDPAIRQFRDEAIRIAKAERAWKDHMLLLMDEAEQARAAQLPTYDAVLTQSDNGYATLLPMVVAWRVARKQGLLSVGTFEDLCRKQASLIEAEIARTRESPPSIGHLETLALYEAELRRST
jgi:hypothetical protein